MDFALDTIKKIFTFSSTLYLEKVPKYPFMLLPLMCCAKKIIVPDLSLMIMKSCRKELNRFRKYLTQRNLESKLVVVDPFVYADTRMESNAEAVMQLFEEVSPLQTVKESEGFFIGNFLAHRCLISHAVRIYNNKIIKKLRNEDKNVLVVKFPLLMGSIVKKRRNALYHFVLNIVILPFLTLALFIAAFSEIVRITRPSKMVTGFSGGVCVDIVGLKHDLEQVFSDDLMEDTFLVQDDGVFSISNMSFFCFQWAHDQMYQWIKYLRREGAYVFGPLFKRIAISWEDIFSLLFNTISQWLKSILTLPSPTGGWNTTNRIFLVLYFLQKMRTKICFLHHRPSVYVNRFDYSPICHPMASVCEELGIHFSGICHSPMAGMWNTPINAIISYKTFFIHSSIYAKDIFPTWSNMYTNLVPIGVWRSDFAVAARNKSTFPHQRKVIRESFKTDFIAAVYLPCSVGWLCNGERCERWMINFEKMLDERKGLSFLLFIRSDRSTNRVINNENMIKHINRMKSTGRAFLASDLKPDWKYSYHWVYVYDLAVCYHFSDAVNEALACGIPAISYADMGRGMIQIEKYDRRLSVYSPNELKQAIYDAMDGKWPSENTWEEIQRELCPPADRKCRQRMRTALRDYAKPIKIFNYNKPEKKES